MKVLTFGWDFPPQTTGGLGIACQGLTHELLRDGVEVIFVLPRTQEVDSTMCFRFADGEKGVQIRCIRSSIAPYRGSREVVDIYDAKGRLRLYSRTILEEVKMYAQKAEEIASEEEFDIIHAHDWTTYLAGVAAKRVSGMPLVLHVHATAYDQAASDHVDSEVFAIERASFHEADGIIAVSDFTKRIIEDKYGVDPSRIFVIHNGCDTSTPSVYPSSLATFRARGKKIVLYHGRITIQKGVDYLIAAARRVVDVDPNVIFVISGSGDMLGQIIEKVSALGLAEHVVFAGALWYEERDRMYQSVDLVVMPSVSEPFGLVPLEAIRHGTSSLISRQSGVAEVMQHALKVDFWDVDQMADKILAALRYPVMREQMVKEGKRDMQHLSWRKAAVKVKALYQRLLQ